MGRTGHHDIGQFFILRVGFPRVLAEEAKGARRRRGCREQGEGGGGRHFVRWIVWAGWVRVVCVVVLLGVEKCDLGRDGMLMRCAYNCPLDEVQGAETGYNRLGSRFVLYRV